jgi:alkylhydroperoxidase family enzyme
MDSIRPPRQPRRDAIAESERPAYDGVVKRFRAWFGAGDAPPEEHFEVGTYFGALLNSPQMCAMASQMGVYFRGVGNDPGSFTHADREFVDQVLSALWSTNVVQNIHIVDAVRAGVRIEAIDALRAGRDDLLTDDERLLTTYIRQVVSGTVEPQVYARIYERMGARGLVEYTGFILWLQWIMRMMQALDTGAVSDDEVEALIEKARTIALELQRGA